jgi:hypothetical protein
MKLKVIPECFGSCNEECWTIWKYENLDCFHECFQETRKKGKLP